MIYIYVIHDTYRCTELVHIGQINNEVLLYGRGNYMHHPVITRVEKNVYMCMTEALCCAAVNNTL